MSHREQLVRWKRRASIEWYVTWFVAAVTYGAGDVLTTTVLVYGRSRLGGANAVDRWIIELFGVGGFLAAKIVVFLVGITISWHGVEAGSRLLYYTVGRED